MKNQQKGFIVPIVIIAVVLVAGGGAYYFFKKPQTQKDNVVATSQEIPQIVKETKVTTEASTSIQAKPTPLPVTKKTPPPAPVAKKNTYTNTVAGYSLELPENWSAVVNTSVSDPNEPEITSSYLVIKGKTAQEQGFSFDIQTATTKHNIDYYKQEFAKTPTYDDLINLFIETQKKDQDEFIVKNTRKTMINGNQAYEISAEIGGGGGTERQYVFYTSKNSYVIQIIGLTSAWKDIEPMVSSVVGSFKIK